MSRTPKNVNNDDAREIATFLLNKGIPQTQIAMVVKKSQSWVAGIKRECDIASFAREEGRQEVRNAIIDNIENKAAREISRGMLHSNNASLLPDNTD